MVTERWSPFRDLLRWDKAMRWQYRPVSVVNTDGWSIPVDIESDGDDYVVKASMPGVDPGNIDITIEDSALTLTAKAESNTERDNDGYVLRERRSGAFRRSVTLPKDVDSDNASCSYEHGVVTVRIPKSTNQKVKRLTLHMPNPPE